jgi:hypothetical protein
MESFTKHDNGKNRLDLIDPDYILGLGEVLSYGAKKYAANNWKQINGQEDIERIKGALLRHMMAYMKGEEFDEESSLQHLHHMAAGAMFLAYFDKRRVHGRTVVNSKA